MRKARSESGYEHTVYKWFVLRNGWEYYMLELPDKHGNVYGLVMGDFDEIGSFNVNEIAPYVIMEAEGEDLQELAPPAGWEWCKPSECLT